MDFTREPIIETIITPKEGCKLVVRSSKGAGQEEFIADAVEVVSFGRSTLYRSLERPKAFLVPVSDYEILEVREARMVLKNVGLDRTIKIGGGREREREPSAKGNRHAEKEVKVEAVVPSPVEGSEEARPAVEKKKDRRRQYRKRRGSQEGEREDGTIAEPALVGSEGETQAVYPTGEEGLIAPPSSAVPFSSLLEPPPALISETISRYRENAMFKSAFFLTEEEQYKPHDKVDELLNEDEVEEGFEAKLQEPIYSEQEQDEEPAPELAQEADPILEPIIEPELISDEDK